MHSSREESSLPLSGRMIIQVPHLSLFITPLSALFRLRAPAMNLKMVSPAIVNSAATEWPDGVIILARRSILMGGFGWRPSTRRILLVQHWRIGAPISLGCSLSKATLSQSHRNAGERYLLLGCATDWIFPPFWDAFRPSWSLY